MVVAEVTNIQHVTTKSKGKTTEWEAREAIRKQATEWVKEANKRNVAELEQQKETSAEVTDTVHPENPTWQTLQECQIMLPLGRLLQLVLRLTDGLKSALTTSNSLPAPAFFSNPGEGPTVVDTNSLAITAIVKGRELPGMIVDGGSSVNVISLRTCDTLGIQD